MDPSDRPSHTVAVLTVSDGVSRGTRQDLTGAALAELLESAGYLVTVRRIVGDEAELIGHAIRDLASQVSMVLTTGGTGFGPRDVTPEATRAVIEREAPGLVQLMLSESLSKTPMAALSRAVAGTCGISLVVNLPGSPRGAIENLNALLPVLPHALTLLAGDTEHRPSAPDRPSVP